MLLSFIICTSLMILAMSGQLCHSRRSVSRSQGARVAPCEQDRLGEAPGHFAISVHHQVEPVPCNSTVDITMNLVHLNIISTCIVEDEIVQ